MLLLVATTWPANALSADRLPKDKPTVRLMGIEAQGTSVVFMIDCSASMGEGKAFSIAKERLIAAVKDISDTQRFQIVFYNQDVHLLKHLGLTVAGDNEKQRAIRFIEQQKANGSTRLRVALAVAVQTQADVVLLVTDGAQPGLRSRDLQEIQRLNRNGTAIHAIEVGPHQHGKKNHLTRLAEQNGGSYKYFEIMPASK